MHPHSTHPHRKRRWARPRPLRPTHGYQSPLHGHHPTPNQRHRSPPSSRNSLHPRLGRNLPEPSGLPVRRSVPALSAHNGLDRFVQMLTRDLICSYQGINGACGDGGHRGQRCQLRAGRNGGYGEAVFGAEGLQGKRLGSRPSGFVKRGAGSGGWEDGGTLRCPGWMRL